MCCLNAQHALLMIQPKIVPKEACVEAQSTKYAQSAFTKTGGILL